MKNISKQTIRLFIAVLFFVHVSNSAAQNTIYEVQGVSSTNSIIREFKMDKYVVYNDQSGVPTF